MCTKWVVVSLGFWWCQDSVNITKGPKSSWRVEDRGLAHSFAGWYHSTLLLLAIVLQFPTPDLWAPMMCPWKAWSCVESLVCFLSSLCYELNSKICLKSILLELKLLFYELRWSVFLEMIPLETKMNSLFCNTYFAFESLSIFKHFPKSPLMWPFFFFFWSLLIAQKYNPQNKTETFSSY